MTDRLDAFLAGERPDDVAVFLSTEFLGDPSALAEHGELVEDGVVVVVEGERGRGLFRQATGTGAMEFAREAMATEGRIGGDLTGGDCPEAGGDGDAADTEAESGGDPDAVDSGGDPEEDRDTRDAVDSGGGPEGTGDTDHRPLFVLAFAEEQNESVGGRYAEGDVVHAYARCSCGQNYSDRWVVGER